MKIKKAVCLLFLIWGVWWAISASTILILGYLKGLITRLKFLNELLMVSMMMNILSLKSNNLVQEFPMYKTYLQQNLEKTQKYFLAEFG